MENYLMRKNIKDEWGILPLQNKILEIAVYIDFLCSEHNVDYCLMGGSALGAKRHGGFIPWDDDMDIFMTPNNYKRFRAVFNSYADKTNFHLQEWTLVGGMISMAKVRMNSTTLIENVIKNKNIHHGIFVDIFILHVCPNNKVKQLWQCFWAKYIVVKQLALRNYNRKGIFIILLIKSLRLTSDYFLIKFALRQVYRYQNEKTDYYCHFLGRAIFNNAIYKKQYFEKTVYAPFETVFLRVQENLHEYLSERFGDYMIPPSKERIKLDQHADFWSVNRDFREVNNKYTDLSDEKRLI